MIEANCRATIELSGDFDWRPAQGLAALGERLRGVALDDGALAEAVGRVAQLGIEMPGVAAADLADAIAASRHDSG